MGGKDCVIVRNAAGISNVAVSVVGWIGRKIFAQIPYRMVKCQAISHPVRNLKTEGSQIRAFNVRQFVQEKSVVARWSAGILSCPGGGATHR